MLGAARQGLRVRATGSTSATEPDTPGPRTEPRVYDLIIRDATIVRPGGRLVADVAVEDGVIAFVGGNPAGKARQEIQGIGRFLIPGVIDGDARMASPGADLPALWAKESRAAVVRGVTCLLHRAATPDSRESLERTLDAARLGSVAAFGTWAVAGGAQDDALAQEVAAGRAIGLSLTVGHGAAPLDRLRSLYEEGDGLLGVLAEDPDLVEMQIARFQGMPSPLHNDLHPPKAALAAARVILELVRQARRPVHIHQLSTADELNLYDPYRDDIPLTAGVTPLHLFLSTDISQQEEGLLKVDPPIRPELDRRALWAAIKRSRVDVFCSGHVPLSRAQKSGPYADAPSGLPGAETLLPLLLGAVKHARLGLEKMVEMCAEAPARIFGLVDKGRIETGADADLLLFSEGETSKLKAEDIATSAGWSPFLGREIGVPPQLVMVGGRILAQDGRLVDDPLPARRVRTPRG